MLTIIYVTSTVLDRSPDRPEPKAKNVQINFNSQDYTVTRSQQFDSQLQAKTKQREEDKDQITQLT